MVARSHDRSSACCCRPTSIDSHRHPPSLPGPTEADRSSAKLTQRFGQPAAAAGWRALAKVRLPARLKGAQRPTGIVGRRLTRGGEVKRGRASPPSLSHEALRRSGGRSDSHAEQPTKRTQAEEVCVASSLPLTPTQPRLLAPIQPTLGQPFAHSSNRPFLHVHPTPTFLCCLPSSPLFSCFFRRDEDVTRRHPPRRWPRGCCTRCCRLHRPRRGCPAGETPSCSSSAASTGARS